ncbi:flagellar hook capping FlgD N-terminal domain-containing protein [Sphingosinithalassobacter portus]|uniref:flagellar hook capping FlgD N-terminal domain-containing protein n=1 Tax=Stakelama portus TaxID=2676234 RepID=UPI000D6E20FA|nr:flagellar hook capping FlgD N-terminal domain-containing protein [Sphingosinithalassobacter portus]
MSAIAPIQDLVPTQSTSTSSSNAGSQSAADAYGLSFESLLKIILTELTYQDPLKPMDNYEFVSQLGQFSQIQQGETMTDRLTRIAESQAGFQATSILGRVVDVPAGATVLTGTVTAVAFKDGVPLLTIETENDQTISAVSIDNISQVREGE